MDPQIKSTLTTLAAVVAPVIATWLISAGIVPASGADALTTTLVNVIVGVAGAAISLFLVWYKQRQHTPTAQIAAVNNAPNGVKVVDQSSPSPVVTAPIPEK
jgi:hypothetical protein